MILSERSTGFETSSKLDASSLSFHSELSSSLSAKLDARLAIEPACSFMDGRGRSADDGWLACLTGSTSFLSGSASLFTSAGD